MRENVARLKMQVNSARMFLAEKVVRGDDGQDHLFGTEVMIDYERWCKQNGYRNADLSVMKDEMRQAFGAEYGRHRVGPRAASGSARVPSWRGVRWADGEKPVAYAGSPEYARFQDERIAERETELDDKNKTIGELVKQLQELRQATGRIEPARPERTTRHQPVVPAPADPRGPSNTTPGELDALMKLLADSDEPAPSAGGR